VTGGTLFALTGGWSPGAAVMSLPPLALVSGLLLNPLPDVEADRRAGCRHLPMLHGRRWAAGLLTVLFGLAYAAPMLGVLSGAVPRGALLAVLTAPLAVSVARGARRHAEDIPALTPVMGKNVALVLSTPRPVAVGLWTIPA
jgi:1,4-dihydroxy-2-naphthoate octaprenyltransferase